MSQKIFVSYKYADNDVRNLNGKWNTTVRTYVDEFISRANDRDFMIYKGEMDGESLADFSDNTIWNKLKERIYDSSVTIVFISPNMKELNKREEDQWIPSEVSYSLKCIQRNGRYSYSNSLLYVIIPDKTGSYRYTLWAPQFRIIQKNEDNEYAEVVTWDNFIRNMKLYIEKANNRTLYREPFKEI